MDAKLGETLSQFLKSKGRILICHCENSPIGKSLAQAALSRGGIPVFWKGDLRWSNLLRLAFTERIGVIAGPPMLLLGLSKLSRQRQTPLFIRNAIVTQPCAAWILEAIERGLDCRCWSVAMEEESFTLSEDLLALRDHLLRWSSVLDCWLVKGSYGLEMNVIIFPGKKLPDFPTCAKLDARAFDAERHTPFYLAFDLRNPMNHPNNH